MKYNSFDNQNLLKVLTLPVKGLQTVTATQQDIVSLK